MGITNEALFLVRLPDELKANVTGGGGAIEVKINISNGLGVQLIHALGLSLGAKVTSSESIFKVNFESLKLSDIKLFLIDLDDTIFRTTKLFNTKKTQAVNVVLEKYPDINKDDFQTRFDSLSKESYNIPSLGVRPLPRWQYVVDKLQEEYEITNETKEAMLNKIMEVYSEAPEFHEGIIEFLEKLQSLGKKVIFVTHAEETWTKIKIDAINQKLGGNFSYVCTPIERDKGSEDWLNASKGFLSNQVLVIGDNNKADIKAGLIAGFVAIKVTYPETWVGFNGDPIPGVVSVENLMEIFDLLEKN